MPSSGVDIAQGANTFPPIADYGFLSDCEHNCLVAPNGAVEWLCLPRPDSPSVFGALLDRGAGTFRFGPISTQVPHQRRYLPGTMVLETTWHTPTGWIVVNDLLVVSKVEPGQRRAGYQRAPGDSAATGTLLRIAHCIKGRVEMLVNAAPVFDYGSAPGEWVYDGDGYETLSVQPPNRRADIEGHLEPRTRRDRGQMLRALEPRRGRHGLRGTLVGRPHADFDGGGRGPDGRDGRLLAGLAGYRNVSRSSVAQLYRAQRVSP